MKRIMKLSEAVHAQKIAFVTFEGCPVRKLQDMGLLPGEKMEIVHNAGHGAVTVCLKGTSVAIGHGLAHRILVREI